MDKFGILALCLVALAFLAFSFKSDECESKGGKLVYSTCVKKDALL